MIKLKTDSRKVQEGDTFIAIKGLTVDGHDYIEQAIKNGATCIVAEHGEYNVETKIVPSTADYIIDELKNNYKNILEDLQLIGVTGTNGKTTTCFIVHQMLRELGIDSAYIGTIGFYYNLELIKELPNTTPEILEIYSLIDEAKNLGAKVIIMEASSHAFSLNRLAGIKFDVGAFTNLTQDHLDYHKTMEEYKEAKKKIFDHLKNNKIVVNADDKYASDFIKDETITIGKNGENFKLNDFILEQGHTTINLDIEGKVVQIKTNFIGEFNVYNYVMALAITNNLGINIDDIIKITINIYPPKGRCQTIKVGNAQAVIDYAHTPDAVEKIITNFSKLKKGKIITIIGCGGDRDPLKRPIMGNIATDNSDYVIFTNDNPRTENEKKIMDDIVRGLKNKNFEIEYDRSKAIKKGMELLNDNDMLLILGKGHENYQIIGNQKIHCDDAQEVEKYK